MSDLFASDEVAAASKRERPSLHSDTDIYRAVAELAWAKLLRPLVSVDTPQGGDVTSSIGGPSGD
jgi:hypothetical protein